MNNDLISRSVLKETIQALIEYDNAEDFDKGYNIAILGVIEKIDNASTVDIEKEVSKRLVKEAREIADKNFKYGYEKAKEEFERPQGEWINKRTIKHDGEFYCSNCDFELESFIQGAFYNFCPNCGADMRGEE